MSDTRSDSADIELVVDGVSGHPRIDRYLAEYPGLNLTRNRIQKLIDEGQITVNGDPVNKKAPVSNGDRICITVTIPPPSDISPEDIPLDIIYEDDSLAVINKPAGLVTHPGAGNRSGTLVNALVHHYRSLAKGSAADRPGIVHRLDKDTTGLLLIARTDEAYQNLQQALQARDVKRTYLALVCGHVKEQEGRIDLPIGRSTRDRTKMAVTNMGSRPAITHYQLSKRYRSYDLLDVDLETGRTHQIRVHLSHLGHPVFGDAEYGGREKWHRGMFAPERPLAKRLLDIMSRQALHARKIEFSHPMTGERMEFEAPLPEDFRKLLAVLESEAV